jgi:response regulator RpfG family c-di-GMP phosphodiesterase
MQTPRYPPNTYLSTFLAARYLEISVFDLCRLAGMKKISTYSVDRYGEKFMVRELQALKETLNGLFSATEKPSPRDMPKSAKPPQSPIAFTPVDYDDVFALFEADEVKEDFFEVPKRHAGLIVAAALYYKTGANTYAIYKNAGALLTRERLDELKTPNLFVNIQESTAAAADVHRAFNAILIRQIRLEDVESTRALLSEMYENTASHPDAKTILLLRESINTIIDEFVHGTLKHSLVYQIESRGSTPAMRVVNIFCLALGFCYYNGYSIDNTREIVFAALMHDVGLGRFPVKIRNSMRERTPEEENLFRCHTIAGGKILGRCNFSDETFRYGAVEHHERLDGSGYPYGITKMTFYGQLISLLDAYDRYVFDARMTGKTRVSENILKVLKSESEVGRFSHDVFRQFSHSVAHERDKP